MRRGGYSLTNSARTPPAKANQKTQITKKKLNYKLFSCFDEIEKKKKEKQFFLQFFKSIFVF